MMLRENAFRESVYCGRRVIGGLVQICASDLAGKTGIAGSAAKNASLPATADRVGQALRKLEAAMFNHTRAGICPSARNVEQTLHIGET